MGFESLDTAIVETSVPLTPEQVKFAEEQLADRDALSLVLFDVTATEQYVSSKALPELWNKNDDDFRARVAAKKWPGSTEYRANLSMPLILEVIESMLPEIYLAFFSDPQPFLLEAQGTTTANAARAAEKILGWAIKKSGFKEAIRAILKSILLYGTGVGYWYGKKGLTDKKHYSYDDDKNVVSETKQVPYFCPKFDHVDLRNILVDSALRTQDIRDGRFVCAQFFITANDLDDLRNDEAYKNVPTREQLKLILATQGEGTVDSLQSQKIQTWRENQAQKETATTSADPLKQPLEILEYRTKDRVITVLQRKIVIRNGDADEDGNCAGFLSDSFIDVLNAFFGFGVGFLLIGDQKLQAGVANFWIDSLALILAPWFHRKKGVASGSQNINIAPGKVVNDDGELTPAQMPSNVTQEAMNALSVTDSRARRRVGANFGPDMPTQALRTAEGVSEFTSGIETRIQYFVEKFAERVFVPALEALLYLCKENMTPQDLNRVLTDEEGKEFEGNILDFYNGEYGLKVLSSTKLAAKRAMASMLPTLMQFFSAAPVQQALLTGGEKLDFGEFIKKAIEITGFDAQDLIVPATPEDMQRAMMMNPMFQRTQTDLQLLAQKQQGDRQLEQDKGDVRGGIQVLKSVLDSAGNEDQAKNEDQAAQPEQPLANQAAQKPSLLERIQNMLS